VTPRYAAFALSATHRGTYGLFFEKTAGCDELSTEKIKKTMNISLK